MINGFMIKYNEISSDILAFAKVELHNSFIHGVIEFLDVHLALHTCRKAVSPSSRVQSSS